MSNVYAMPARRLRDFPDVQQGRNGVKPNLFNTCIMFREAAEFRGRIAYDEFSMRTLVRGPLPWNEEVDRYWDNHDDNAATEWAQRLDLQVKRETIQQAVETVAYEGRFHPVRAWMGGLEWDGKQRIDKWLTYYAGADQTIYTRAIGRCFLIAAVARIWEPGCKVDNVLVLEGMEDLGKSSLIRALASPDWFTDDLADFGSKDAAMQMRGKWIIELGEMEQWGRSDDNRTAAFISRQVDRFRPPYGARVIEAPRECVFIGTTNRYDYLTKPTGNRRVWPVRCNALDVAAIADDRDQLWAEALVAYRAGERWWITEPAVLRAAKAEQSARSEEEVWERPIMEWLEAWATPKEHSTAEILAEVCKISIGDQNNHHKGRVAKVMMRAGYQQRESGARRWFKP